MVIALFFFTVAHPQAYIDPGSASYVFQLLAGGVLGGVFLLRTYWARVKASAGRVIRLRRAAQ